MVSILCYDFGKAAGLGWLIISQLWNTHQGSQSANLQKSERQEIRRENGGFSQESKKFGGKTEGFHKKVRTSEGFHDV